MSTIRNGAASRPDWVPVSIVCVFNDPAVREQCLDRSIQALAHEALAVDYIPVDNTAGTFRTAGSALNHGARAALHSYVVFVHQDVYLHSLVSLERAAAAMSARADVALVGAVGMDSRSRMVGRIRDPCTLR